MTGAAVFVRAATPSDERTISAHREAASIEAARYRGKPEAPGESSEAFELVAGVGSSVFGSLRLARLDETRWRIDHVFVEPDAREVGIGDALVLAALGALAERGARWIGATALPGDRAMKNLFERHGLVAQSITVGRDL